MRSAVRLEKGNRNMDKGTLLREDDRPRLENEASLAASAGSNASDSRSRDLEAMKLDINNLVWMYAPGTITLNEADDIASEIMDMILAGRVKR